MPLPASLSPSHIHTYATANLLHTNATASLLASFTSFRQMPLPARQMPLPASLPSTQMSSMVFIFSKQINIVERL